MDELPGGPGRFGECRKRLPTEEHLEEDTAEGEVVHFLVVGALNEGG